MSNKTSNSSHKNQGVSRPLSRISKEVTAGGVVYRFNKRDVLEILLIQDNKGRWSLPKGHVEAKESLRQTALREIQEETGLKNLKVLHSLGKVNFQYRQDSSLVVITMHVFLVQSLSDDKLQKEAKFADIRWMSIREALSQVEYDDIIRIILLAAAKIRKMHHV